MANCQKQASRVTRVALNDISKQIKFLKNQEGNELI